MQAKVSEQVAAPTVAFKLLAACVARGKAYCGSVDASDGIHGQIIECEHSHGPYDPVMATKFPFKITPHPEDRVPQRLVLESFKEV